MNWSRNCWTDCRPQPPMSPSRLPDTIRVMNAPSPSLTFTTLLLLWTTVNANWKKKWGLLGNETKHWSDNQYNESVTSSVAIDLMLTQDSAQFVHAHFHPELHLVKNVWTLCFQGPEVKGVVVTVGYQTALCMCVCVRVYVFECVCVCVCAYVFVCAYKSDAENFTKLFLCNTV